MSTVVVDASVVVAALSDSGTAGARSRELMGDVRLAAPHVMTFEVANVLRRAELAGAIGSDAAALAHADLLDLAIDLWPYQALAGAAWGLRHNVTVPDAAYVVLAHLLDAPLLTLDQRLASAPGVECAVIVPGR